MEKNKTFTQCLTFGERQKRPSTRNVHDQLLNIVRNLQMVWPAIMWESSGQMIGLCGHIMAVEYEAILQDHMITVHYNVPILIQIMNIISKYG